MSALGQAVANRLGCAWGLEEATHELILYSDKEPTDPRATEPLRERTDYGCDVHTAQHLEPYDEVLPLVAFR